MTSDGDDTNTPADGPPPRPGLLDTYRSWPQWARIMAPVAAVILGLALDGGAPARSHTGTRTRAGARAVAGPGELRQLQRGPGRRRHAAAPGRPRVRAAPRPRQRRHRL